MWTLEHLRNNDLAKLTDKSEMEPNVFSPDSVMVCNTISFTEY